MRFCITYVKFVQYEIMHFKTDSLNDGKVQVYSFNSIIA